jgi:hypothetical protein
MIDGRAQAAACQIEDWFPDPFFLTPFSACQIEDWFPDPFFPFVFDADLAGHDRWSRAGGRLSN